MTTFKIHRPTTPATTTLTRFAVGAESGSLYVIAPHNGNMGTLIIGRTFLTGREGKRYLLKPEEILPPGTVIEITT